MTTRKTLPTLWEVPDDLWERILPVLDADDPPKSTGRPRADRRKAFDAIIFRMRTGCQWNRLPKELGDDSTAHRYFQRWSANGIFRKIWSLLVEECRDLGAINWTWQSADASMGKARFGGILWARIRRIEARKAVNAASS